jgi:hypothetical protein
MLFKSIIILSLIGNAVWKTLDLKIRSAILFNHEVFSFKTPDFNHIDFMLLLVLPFQPTLLRIQYFSSWSLMCFPILLSIFNLPWTMFNEWPSLHSFLSIWMELLYCIKPTLMFFTIIQPIVVLSWRSFQDFLLHFRVLVAFFSNI